HRKKLKKERHSNSRHRKRVTRLKKAQKHKKRVTITAQYFKAQKTNHKVKK
ncbi:hypothetical protein NDU88_002575, partial [Pleurodeles waltl]